MRDVACSSVQLFVFVLAGLIILPLSPCELYAQGVAINSSNTNPDASAMLDVSSTTKGMLIPRMTAIKRTAIVSPATGLLVYQTDSPTGFYFYDGASWVHLIQNGSSGVAGQVAFWNSNTGLSGSNNLFWDNANVRLGLGTNAPNEQLELTGNLRLPATTATVGILYSAGSTLLHTYGADNTFLGEAAGNLSSTGSKNSGFGISALTVLTSGSSNTATGYRALYSNTSGFSNTAIGSSALKANIDGNYNTATGNTALYRNSAGTDNTASGYQALYSNTSGSFNTATGSWALYSNTGANNTASGYSALSSNVGGADNTAVGCKALYSNSAGDYNTATGYMALYSNTASNNTAFGYSVLTSNTNGTDNTASGYLAMYLNQDGSSNTAIGREALYANTGGASNTACGYFSMRFTTGSNNTAIGYQSLNSNNSGSSNIAIGYQAGSNLTSGSNNICIGNSGNAGESSTIRIGSSQTTCFIKGINGVTTTGGIAVYVNGNGKLGTVTSSRRFKHDIRDMGTDSDALMKLRPVSFRYKVDYDPEQSLQYGIIAEEAAEIAPELVAYDEEGKPYSVFYHKVNAMLLNEVQKQYKINQAQQRRIEELEEKMQGFETLQAQLDILHAKVREMDRWSEK